jgi:hypothetical protein
MATTMKGSSLVEPHVLRKCFCMDGIRLSQQSQHKHLCGICGMYITFIFLICSHKEHLTELFIDSEQSSKLGRHVEGHQCLL